MAAMYLGTENPHSNSTEALAGWSRLVPCPSVIVDYRSFNASFNFCMCKQNTGVFHSIKLATANQGLFEQSVY